MNREKGAKHQVREVEDEHNVDSYSGSCGEVG